MELSDYIVYENASKVEVCAVLNGAKAGTDIRVYFELIPDNANVTGKSYFWSLLANFLQMIMKPQEESTLVYLLIRIVTAEI